MDSRWQRPASALTDYLAASTAARMVLAEALRHRDTLRIPQHADDGKPDAEWAWLLAMRLVRMLHPPHQPGRPTAAERQEYVAEIAAVAVRWLEALLRRDSEATAERRMRP